MYGRIYTGGHYTLLHTKYESSGPCGFGEEDFFFLCFSHCLWELSVAMETTILIQSASKPTTINLLTKSWFTSNLIMIGQLASEIFIIEIVDDDDERQRQTTDVCLSYKLTCEPSAQVS